MQSCIFCQNQRTIKRGEHVWDDWLNREGGLEIRDPSTTYYYGNDGEFIRSHPSNRMAVTLPVVCDTCNNTWMSDLSGFAKTLLEPSIRRDEPGTFNAADLLKIASFAFLKSAVLDWSAIQNHRKPCLSRAVCCKFRDSLVTPGSLIALPVGLQVWLARYRRKHVMEALAFTEEMTGARQFKGYQILVITYVVGSFIFQLTYPRWRKRTRNRSPAPFFEIIGDLWSVPIWPGVGTAYWPPLLEVESRSLEIFRERFRRIRIPIPPTM